MAILLVSAFAGTIVYYNGIINDKNTQITSLNQQVSNLAAQVSNLSNMTTANENITFIDFNSYFAGNSYGQYNWTITLDLKNTGNATATINNVIINGQPYSNFNPAPLITPSIQNGYALSPNQSVTIILQDTNSTSAPHDGTYVYVLTAIGNSYSSSFIGS